MTDLNPNTPILVAAAAVQQREETAGSGLEPYQLMVAALEKAAAEVGAAELLSCAERVEVPKGMWHYSDPAWLVADAIGAEQAQTVLAEIGILQQTCINRACNSIASGEISIAIVTGAEARYRSLRGQIEGVEIAETAQDNVAPDVYLQPDAELWSEVESATGLGMPVGFYAIMDSALRAALDRNMGFKLAGEKALQSAGKQSADIDHMELYYCFPQAVRVQVQELSLPADRPLSVTGAMTFGGGPLNNFVFQAAVKMAQLLRENPGQIGLVTCVSGMNTKQGCGLYSTAPNPDGWQYADVTEQVKAATELCELVAEYEGGAAIAGYTVLYQGDRPWRAVAVCDLPGGKRTVVYCEQAVILEACRT